MGDELIPQPHGGAIRKPWTPASASTASRTPMRALRREAARLFAQATPDIAKRLIETALTTEDERTLAVIGTAILDRSLGKSSDRPLASEQDVRVAIGHLTPSQKVRLADAFATIEELLGIRPVGVIDGKAEPGGG